MTGLLLLVCGVMFFLGFKPIEQAYDGEPDSKITTEEIVSTTILRLEHEKILSKLPSMRLEDRILTLDRFADGILYGDDERGVKTPSGTYQKVKVFTFPRKWVDNKADFSLRDRWLAEGGKGNICSKTIIFDEDYEQTIYLYETPWLNESESCNLGR